MNRWVRWSIILTCFIIVFDSGAITTNGKVNKKYSQVIAFGDSYSDNGNALKISTEIVKNHININEAYIKPKSDLYWNGRYSNGYTAIEVLASKLNIPLNNYAVGGATSGLYNYSSWMDTLYPTGVLGQVNLFKENLNGKKADKNALYFIFVSANDYFAFVDYNVSGKVEIAADESIDNIKIAIRQLYRLGAKNFMVINSSDLSMVPYEIEMKRTNTASKFTKYVNHNLPKELDNLEELLEVDILLFDLPKVSNEIKSNKEKYNIKIFTKPCEVTYPKPLQAKKNALNYYFWDEWHYTKSVHKIIGSKMYEAVIN